MKKHLKITGIALALAMAMMLAVAAFAESPDTPAAETPAADAPSQRPQPLTPRCRKR